MFVLLIVGTYTNWIANKTIETFSACFVDTTWKSYEGAWEKYSLFCGALGLAALPPNPAVLAMFMVHCEQTLSLKYKTIESTMSGIAFWLEDAGFSLPYDHILVKKTKAALKKRAPPVDKKLPVTLEHLLRISYVVRESLNDHRNYLVLLVSFFGLLRISEVIKLNWEDITWKGDTIWLRVAPSKKQLGIENVPICANSQSRFDVIHILQNWRSACVARGLATGGIFKHVVRNTIRDKVIKKSQGRTVCAELFDRAGFDPNLMVTHGARRGGYQLCESVGSEVDAQHMGRWISAETTREYSGGHVAARLRMAQNMAAVPFRG